MVCVCTCVRVCVCACVCLLSDETFQDEATMLVEATMRAATAAQGKATLFGGWLAKYWRNAPVTMKEHTLSSRYDEMVTRFKFPPCPTTCPGKHTSHTTTSSSCSPPFSSPPFSSPSPSSFSSSSSSSSSPSPYPPTVHSDPASYEGTQFRAPFMGQTILTVNKYHGVYPDERPGPQYGQLDHLYTFGFDGMPPQPPLITLAELLECMSRPDLALSCTP